MKRITGLLIAMAMTFWVNPGLVSLPLAYAGQSKPKKASQQKELLEFNAKSHKFHKPSWNWTQCCTRHCIEIPLSEVVRRGGIPCKVCGGYA